MVRTKVTSLLSAVLLASGSSNVNAQTAAVQQSLELDNSDVRVRRLILDSGIVLAPFDHPESVAVFIRGEQAHITPDGPSTQNGWKPAAIVGAGRHGVQNDGDTVVEVVWVELKKPGSITDAGMPRDAMKVDAARHRVVAENANVRVLLHTATSGQTGAPHDHPSYLTVLIAGVTPRGGPGTITWTNGPFTHGGIPAAQALQAIVIELKSGSGTGK